MTENSKSSDNTPSEGTGDTYGSDGRHIRVLSKDEARKNLLRIMEGVKFPQDRAGLIKHAKTKENGIAIIKWLENLPVKKSYQTLEEFRQAFEKDYDDYGAVRDPDVRAGPGEA